MPTNLPPEYREADRRYREASTVPEKIAALEDVLSSIPKHKGTDKLRGDLRRKLSKLKASAQTRKSSSKRDHAFYIEREGAGQAVLVGLANVGKSALLSALSNASPEVSEVPFSTWRPTPGMMQVMDIQVQLIDTPPLSPGFIEPLLMDLIRRADLVLVVVDLMTEPLRQLKESVALLEAHRIHPLRMRHRYPEDRRTTFMPFLVLANKCDDDDSQDLCDLFCEMVEQEWPIFPVSATTGRGMDRFKQAVFDRLEIVRVYSKAPGMEADLGAPYILKVGSTIADLARKVHLDFYKNLKSARIWGSGAFEGQMVSRDYVLQDGDIVELRI